MPLIAGNNLPLTVVDNYRLDLGEFGYVSSLSLLNFESKHLKLDFLPEIAKKLCKTFFHTSKVDQPRKLEV
jgi:hypothetical protein